MEQIKIGVCGSLLYENKSQIKETIFKLKNTFGDALMVISGGRTDGADTYVKKYTLEFGCKYKEYNPSYTNKNVYSIDWFKHKPNTNKNHSRRHRNSMMIKEVDYMIVFVEEGKGDSDIEHLITETNKKGKRLVIMD